MSNFDADNQADRIRYICGRIDTYKKNLERVRLKYGQRLRHLETEMHDDINELQRDLKSLRGHLAAPSSKSSSDQTSATD